MATKYLFVYYPTLGARSLVPNASFNAGGVAFLPFLNEYNKDEREARGPPDHAQTPAAKPQTHAVNDLEALVKTTRSRPRRSRCRIAGGNSSFEFVPHETRLRSPLHKSRMTVHNRDGTNYTEASPFVIESGR
jgi:hypothetical protein